MSAFLGCTYPCIHKEHIKAYVLGDSVPHWTLDPGAGILCCTVLLFDARKRCIPNRVGHCSLVAFVIEQVKSRIRLSKFINNLIHLFGASADRSAKSQVAKNHRK